MQEFNRAGAVLQLLLHYAHALSMQIAQTAVCNRQHSVEQQLCRWLLLSLDGLSSDTLAISRKLAANMRGVYHAALIEAAGNLQRSGLIYRPGLYPALD